MTNTTPSAEPAAEVRVPGAPGLAVRVRPGAGTPLVLLHGLGRTLEDWEPLAPLLGGRPQYAVDLRGHGRSEDGSCTLDGLVDDVIRVLGHFGLERAAVIGHSLGGMVAAEVAARRSDLAAAVDIDGHGWPAAEPTAARLGIGAEEAEVQIGLVRAFTEEQAAAFMAPVPADAFAASLDGYLELGPHGGAMAAGARRAAVELDGLAAPRPGPRAVRAFYGAFDEFSPARTARRLLVPLLTLVSTAPVPALPGSPVRFAEVLAAQAATELERTAPLLTAHAFDAPHAMHLTHPEAVAARIEGFLTALGR
ncbi:alpha/beta fold hydrolase [Nocardiopsis potens]|uniref:alpha/beta fold hydrolase n=1 Tax=Nocardiopsis potens TaxID=1246458 RepID=UPI00034B6A40|nr:alpha/beta hydrolase [Nocardiopsis potens]